MLIISKELLQAALSESVKDTYNMVSVDGDTSTNDTVLLLANGLAGNKKIETKEEDYKKFAEALNYVIPGWQNILQRTEKAHPPYLK